VGTLRPIADRFGPQEDGRVDSAVRLLRLLSLLQTRAHWPGHELADRIGVTARTLRRDVARLRGLGYPIDADPGVAGGYRLGTGGRLPPLLLDDSEAVAIAVGLRMATTAGVLGVEDTAIAALAKLHDMLPARLRERVDALASGTVPLPRPDLQRIDTDALLTIATGCRRTEGLRFRYTDNQGQASERSVEPLRIVHTGRRWYLVARDRNRDDWRTFRVDRITDPVLTGHRYRFTDPPDPVALVSEGVAYAPYDIKAQVLVQAPYQDVARAFPPSVALVEPAGPRTALLRVAAVELAPLVTFVCGLSYEFEVLDPPELREHLRALGERLVRHH